MTVIMTKTLQATTTKGLRVKAYTDHPTRGRVSVIVPYNYALDYPQVHAAAAQALAEKLGLCANFVAGETTGGMVFMLSDGPTVFSTVHLIAA